MADTTYNVRVKYDLDKSNAESGAASLAKTFDRLAMAVSGAFAVHKILDFTAKLVLLQSQNEQFQISLATMLTGFGAPGFTKGINSFKDAMGASAGLMQQIRKDAAALPGTAEDLMMIMQQAMPGAIRSGHSVLGQNSAFDISKKLLLASQYIPGGAATAAREFSALMEGRAIGRNDLFARIRPAMREGAPISAKEFNALDEQKRWDMVSRALTTIYGPALGQYANSWKSVFTTTQNWVQQLSRVVSASYFDSLKTNLKDVNDWVTKNQTSIEGMLKSFAAGTGDVVGGAFSAMKDALSFLVTNQGTIKPMLELLGTLVLGGKLMSGFSKRSAGAAMMGGAMGLGINALTGGNEYSGGLMGIAGMLVSFGGSLGIAAAAVVTLGAAANMAAQALDDWQKDKMANHERGQSLMNLYKTFDATGALGDTGLRQATEIINQYRLSEPGAKNGGSINMQRFAGYFGALTDLDTTSYASRNSALRMLEYANSINRDRTEFGPKGPNAVEAAFAKLYDKPPAVPKPRDVNVTINIKQDISQAEDPERLLVMTQRAIEDALIRPIESGNNRFSPLR